MSRSKAAEYSLGIIVHPRREKALPAHHPDLPYVGLEHIESNSTKLLGMVAASEMRSTANKFYPGDVLYARLRPYLNKVWKADFEGLCSSEFIIMPGNELVDSGFLRYRLNSPDFVSFATHLNTGDRPRVDFNQLSSFKILLPSSLAHQRRIVSEIEKQFTRLEAGVAALQRVQANLKRYRASVLKAACEGRLVPTEAELARQEGRSYETGAQLLARILEERRAAWEQQPGRKKKYIEPQGSDNWDLPTLPEGWTWASANQCTSTITDGEHITPERSPSGVLLLSARNILDGKLSLENVDYVPEFEYQRIAKRLVIEPGDVLLSCSGSVGRSCIAPSHLRFTLVRSVAVLKPLLQMGNYLSLALQSPQLQRQISERKTQTTQANIFQGKIKMLAFPIPPLPEQHRIVAEVERRLSVIEELEAVVKTNLQRAQRLRQSILQQAFSGKLVTTDNTDNADKEAEQLKLPLEISA